MSRRAVLLRPPTWIPDEDAKTCMLCSKPFSFSLRRHHCRACGRVVCNVCSLKRVFLFRFDLREKKERVCDKCFEVEVNRIHAVDVFIETHVPLLKNGGEFMLHDGVGLPKARYLKLSADYGELLVTELTSVNAVDRAEKFAVASLLHVKEGVESEHFEKALSSDMANIFVFFSLEFSHNRCLDLEARDEKHARLWIPAFKSLIQTVEFLHEERVSWTDLRDHLLLIRPDEIVI
eukprot:ANDGO_04036.mRNA.1 Lateral signaling target protein 2 homolog